MCSGTRAHTHARTRARAHTDAHTHTIIGSLVMASTNTQGHSNLPFLTFTSSLHHLYSPLKCFQACLLHSVFCVLLVFNQIADIPRLEITSSTPNAFEKVLCSNQRGMSKVIKLKQPLADLFLKLVVWLVKTPSSLQLPDSLAALACCW